jgi:hypothetical protein
LRLCTIATVRTWSTLGELKRGIDHPCFGMTRGRPITTLGPMATMLCGFIFERLMYAPSRNLIAVVGGLQSNRNHLSSLVPPIIFLWNDIVPLHNSTPSNVDIKQMQCLVWALSQPLKWTDIKMRSEFTPRRIHYRLVCCWNCYDRCFGA